MKVDGIREALEIVLGLAEETALDPRHCDDDQMIEAAAEQQEAIETVQLFLDDLVLRPPARCDLGPFGDPCERGGSAMTGREC